MDNRMLMLDVNKMMDTTNIQQEVEVETSSNNDFHCENENSMDNLELLDVESVYDDGKLILSIIEKDKDDQVKEIGDKQTLVEKDQQQKQKQKKKKKHKEKVVGAVGVEHTRKRKSDLRYLRKQKVVAIVYSDHDPNGDSEKNYMLQAARRTYNHYHFGGEALSNGDSFSHNSQSLPAPILAPEAPAFNDLNSTHVPVPVHSQVDGVRNESLTVSHESTITMAPRYPGFESMRMRISTPDSDCCIID